jgi:membrane-associated phospholipid phosphatase
MGKYLLCLTLALPIFAQPADQPQAPDPVTRSATANSSDQDRPPANAQGQSEDKAVLKPKPGQEAIKPKDYSDVSGYLHPMIRVVKFVGYDQKGVWTSPFHTSKKNAKWWLIFGGATGGFIAVDKYISKNAPTSPGLVRAGNDVSYLGQAYTLLPISAAMYFGGTAFHDDHFRETGLLAFETLADVTIAQLVLKSLFDRQRPLQGQGNGEFESATGARYSSSFPSGHAIETFALASVIAHEYPHKKWVQIAAYGYAAGVVGARLAANQHFPGDVMAGGAIGWFVGDYVYGKRHNPALDKKPSLVEKTLDHLNIGFSLQPNLPRRE